jgi:SAM-dependent methyltransferase
VSPYPSIGVAHERVADHSKHEIEILGPERNYRSECEYYRDVFPQLVGEFQGAASVLDVGCGTGRLLELLRDRPEMERVGVELNAERSVMARAKADCEVLQVPLASLDDSRRFDVVTLINVFSHLTHPDAAFAKLRTLLRPSGRLIVKTGEVVSSVRRSAVPDWGIPEHVQFLGLGTVDWVCAAYGFAKVRHDRVPLARELFEPGRWRTQGRGWWRNAVKSLVVGTPGGLAALSAAYRLLHGDSVYSSLIVLTPGPGKDGAA